MILLPVAGPLHGGAALDSKPKRADPNAPTEITITEVAAWASDLNPDTQPLTCSMPSGSLPYQVARSTRPDSMNAEYMAECCQSLTWSITNFPSEAYRFL